MLMDPTKSHVTDLKTLITAEEAFPEMERAFLNAKEEIWAGYRVFDLETKLRSREAREIGEDWFDLIVHTLRRGVSLNMVLSDFDPIIALSLHRASWRSRRMFIGASEVAGPKARLRITNAAHSARVGLLPRMLFWPRLVKELRQKAEEINACDPDARDKLLIHSPGLRPWLREKADGSLGARAWRPPPMVPGTHHQKLAVFDRETLCIGGLDLDERRYDDKGHHRRRDETWHDVQVMCRGAVVADAQRHLEGFLNVVAAQDAPGAEGHMLRTLSRRRKLQFPFLSPRPMVDTLAKAHHARIAEAQHLIYFETQFFRDRKIAQELAAAARRNPKLTLILVLPAAPEDAAFNNSTSSDVRFGEYLQARSIGMIQDAFGDRAAICSPVRKVPIAENDRSTLCGAPIIYVHAKLSIFDARTAIVSSANLNGRSLLWDTEAGIELTDAAQVKSLHERAFRHWQGDAADAAFYEPGTAAARWRDRAAANAALAPEARQGHMVPYEVEPAKHLGRWLPFLPEALV